MRVRGKMSEQTKRGSCWLAFFFSFLFSGGDAIGGSRAAWHGILTTVTASQQPPGRNGAFSFVDASLVAGLSGREKSTEKAHGRRAMQNTSILRWVTSHDELLA